MIGAGRITRPGGGVERVRGTAGKGRTPIVPGNALVFPSLPYHSGTHPHCLKRKSSGSTTPVVPIRRLPRVVTTPICGGFPLGRMGRDWRSGPDGGRGKPRVPGHASGRMTREIGTCQWPGSQSVRQFRFPKRWSRKRNMLRKSRYRFRAPMIADFSSHSALPPWAICR